jgi:hypothetical protein
MIILDALTPFIPLSNRFFLDTRISYCSIGGEILRGGFAPSLLNSPFQP